MRLPDEDDHKGGNDDDYEAAAAAVVAAAGANARPRNKHGGKPGTFSLVPFAMLRP
jgi:hypothetical protein